MSDLALLDNTCPHGGCEHAGVYYVRGSCSNCGDEFRLKLTKGHEKPSHWLGLRCPTCGNHKVGGHELIKAKP
jgi:DNA-directed RNA polymerase subunit RPC12/RpoP